MKSISNIIIGVLCLILIFFVYDMFTREKEVIEVPIRILVPVPSKEGTSDTIYKPSPTTEISVENPLNEGLSNKNKKLLEENRFLLENYRKLDSLNKELQYTEAITIKEYNQSYKDNFQTVDVFTKTRGELLEQSISYKTEKYFIPLDTTVTTKVKGKFKVIGQLEIGTPVLNKITFDKVIIKPSILFMNSKSNALSVSLDTEGNAYLGAAIKF